MRVTLLFETLLAAAALALSLACATSDEAWEVPLSEDERYARDRDECLDERALRLQEDCGHGACDVEIPPDLLYRQCMAARGWPDEGWPHEPGGAGVP